MTAPTFQMQASWRAAVRQAPLNRGRQSPHNTMRSHLTLRQCFSWLQSFTEVCSWTCREACHCQAATDPESAANTAAPHWIRDVPSRQLEWEADSAAHRDTAQDTQANDQLCTRPEHAVYTAGDPC